jgi:DNA-binding transcriptional LysR family regulator
MSIRRLKTLVAVAEHGSFGAAAETVYLCQSAVSLQMKSLEKEFGVPLFDRTKRPPALNQIGQALIPKARAMIENYDSLIDSITGEDALSGELSIGALATTMGGIVPGAISALREIYPKLHILVSPDHSPNMMPLVERGHLDAAVLSEPPFLSSNLEFKPFAEEPLIVLAPLDCESDDPREILRTNPFIRFTRSLWAGQWIDSWLRKENVLVNETMELESLDMISTMVYHNLGVSIVPHRCIPSPNPLPLKRVLLGPAVPPRILGVLVHRENPKSALTDVFYEQIVQLIKNQEEQVATAPAGLQLTEATLS